MPQLDLLGSFANFFCQNLRFPLNPKKIKGGSDRARALQVGGIGHVGGCREEPYDTRVSGSDRARALQVGGIGHVGGCSEALYDTRETAQTERGQRTADGGIGHVGGCRWAPYDTRESV